jgi:ABC transporter ATM
MRSWHRARLYASLSQPPPKPPVQKDGVPPKKLTDTEILRELSRYLWPKDDMGVKVRVVTALSLLVAGKVWYQSLG